MKSLQPVKLFLLAILACFCLSQGELNQPEAKVSLQSNEPAFDSLQWLLRNEQVTSAHLDNDHILDRVVGRIEGNSFRTEVFLSNSKGSTLLHTPLSFPAAEIKVYDIDNDNDNDLVVQEIGRPGILNAWLGDGQGQFVRSTCLLQSLPSQSETKLKSGAIAVAALSSHVLLAFEKTTAGFSFPNSRARDAIGNAHCPIISSTDRSPSISRGPPARFV